MRDSILRAPGHGLASDQRATTLVSATHPTASEPVQRRDAAKRAVSTCAATASALGAGTCRISSSCRQSTIRAPYGRVAWRTVAAQALNSSAAAPWMTALRANRPRPATTAGTAPGAVPAGVGHIGTRRPPYVCTARAATPSSYARLRYLIAVGYARSRSLSASPAAPLVCPYIAARTATLATGRSTP